MDYTLYGYKKWFMVHIYGTFNFPAEKNQSEADGFQLLRCEKWVKI